MRTLLLSFLLLNGCGPSFDVAEPGDPVEDSVEDSGEAFEASPDVASEDTGRIHADFDTSPRSDTASGDTLPPAPPKDSGVDAGAPVDTAPLDTAPAPDTAKPDTACKNPDDWTNCGMCCYPESCRPGGLCA